MEGAGMVRTQIYRTKRQRQELAAIAKALEKKRLEDFL
jgi:hypothetical protein